MGSRLHVLTVYSCTHSLTHSLIVFECFCIYSSASPFCPSHVFWGASFFPQKIIFFQFDCEFSMFFGDWFDFYRKKYHLLEFPNLILIEPSPCSSPHCLVNFYYHCCCCCRLNRFCCLVTCLWDRVAGAHGCRSSQWWWPSRQLCSIPTSPRAAPPRGHTHKHTEPVRGCCVESITALLV